MAGEMPKMPKAIWAKPTVSMTFVQIGFGDDDGARREMSGKWRNDKEEGGTAYIRADLAVLATTHQRTLEALKRLVTAVANMRVPQNQAEAALQVTVTIGPALAEAQAALARIKEAT